MLNPSASRAGSDARKYQQPTTSNTASPSGYDCVYPGEYASYETRPTSYRERTGRYNSESYGPPNVHSPPQTDPRWNRPTYSQQQEIPIPIPIPVSTRTAGHSNALDEFKRPSDATGSGWGQDSSRRTRRGSLSSAHVQPVHDYRLQSSPGAETLSNTPGYATISAMKVPRHARELSNEDIAIREAMRSGQGSNRIISETRGGYRKFHPSYHYPM